MRMASTAAVSTVCPQASPIESGMAPIAAWRALVTEGFTDEERETLARLTGKLVRNARRYMEGRK